MLMFLNISIPRTMRPFFHMHRQLSRFLARHLVEFDLQSFVEHANHTSMRFARQRPHSLSSRLHFYHAKITCIIFCRLFRGLHGSPFAVFHRPERFGCTWQGRHLDRNRFEHVRTFFPVPTTPFVASPYREMFEIDCETLGITNVVEQITKQNFRLVFGQIRLAWELRDPTLHVIDLSQP